jgi:hypothetical protein
MNFKTAVVVDAMNIPQDVEEELMRFDIPTHHDNSLTRVWPETMPLFCAWLVEHEAIAFEDNGVYVGILGT